MLVDKQKDVRAGNIQRWAEDLLGAGLQWEEIPQDASFRRYFRVRLAEKSWVLMDSPPEQENADSFVKVSKAFNAAGLNVPVVHAYDAEQGFLLLTDLGDRLYPACLNEGNQPAYYGEALSALTKIYACQIEDLPLFGKEAILEECTLFQQWFIEKYCKYSLSATEKRLLKQTYNRLAMSAVAQPVVTLHRDYHAANLMALEEGGAPGILDFQGAQRGPVTYDAVCLLRDSRLSLPVDSVITWAVQFKKMLEDKHLMAPTSIQQYLHWFDWMGLQVHLKILGIFARLHLRDNKSHYLAHMPRLMEYVFQVCERYPVLAEFSALICKIDSQRITVRESLHSGSR